MKKMYKIFTFTLCIMFILTACAPCSRHPGTSSANG